MLTGDQLRMARAALRLTVKDTADLAGIDKGTVVRIEAGENAYSLTLRRLREVLENAGVIFLDAKEGVHRATVALKWSAEPARKGSVHDNDAGDIGDEGLKQLGALPGWAGMAPISRQTLINAFLSGELRLNTPPEA